MATGWGPTAGNHALTTETALYTWMQLHTATPGAAGATAVATETSRKQIVWGTAASGSIANITNPVTWTSIAGSQQALFFTAWNQQVVSGSAFGFSGSATGGAYIAGDTLTFAVGAITASLTLAS